MIPLLIPRLCELGAEEVTCMVISLLEIQCRSDALLFLASLPLQLMISGNCSDTDDVLRGAVDNSRGLTVVCDISVVVRNFGGIRVVRPKH